jgi:2,3-diaminopropionate biosynthesis protein SbnA
MIAKSPLELMFGDVFYEMSGILSEAPVYVKLEGFHIGRSIKIKPAIAMIEDLEQRGLLRPGSKLVESSSGNMGLALSIVCSAKGYDFTCVSDPNISEPTRNLIELHGGRVVIVDRRDSNGGFLNTRIELIKRWLEEDPTLIWLNQYANPLNKGAHTQSTGPEILNEFPQVDYLFIAAGTAGTVIGCAEFFDEHSPQTKVIAVDTVGSVTFGHEAGPRHIPGVGMSRKPELVDPSFLDDVLMIPEHETVLKCREVRRATGLVVGGSTGTVLCGVERYANRVRPGETAVAISPDFGDCYADTVYNDDWVLERFPMLADELGSNRRPADISGQARARVQCGHGS